jgi:1A family penicillin-binding protein
MFRFKRRRHHNKKRSRLFVFATAFAACVVFIGIAAWMVFILVEIPSINSFEKREVPESTKIYDQTGEVVLWEIHGEERRTVVPFDKISRQVKNATVAIEDKSFYSHRGVRPLSLLRAIFLDVFKQERQGGSTITQQLVKNTLLTRDQTISRKFKEIIIAIKLETVYQKDEILNLYLNEIPYGSNAYGIEAASRLYFGKSADSLTLAESAYLAALPNAPSYYSPYGNHRAELDNRKNLVLKQMLDLNFIDQKEFDGARDTKVAFLPKQKSGLRAPHFAIYVRELLNEKFGDDVVERGGLKIITTLDAKLQEKAEEIIARKSAENKVKFNASNAGLIALDPKTGRILAMVGSRDYFDMEHEGNFNITLARRQPGSAFKPIVYATAFKKGYTPETVVFDLETNFSVNKTPYIPHNYDDKFRGPVTLREALAQSLNVPAVKTLYLAGIQDSIETARDFGISTLTDKSRYGLTLVLGGGEVTLLELTSAYGVFANNGLRADYHAIKEIRDKNNAIIEEERVVTRQVIDSNIASLITSILSDNAARTPSFGNRSPLYFENYSVAAKTGTTNDYRDAWTIGYSPNIVVGTWAGNNNNSSMTKNVAGFIVAPMWREFMDAALPSTQNDAFIAPAESAATKPVLKGVWRGSKTYYIDTSSGKLATEYTPPQQKEERVLQQVHSILYWVSKDNPNGPIPEHPEQDSQFYNWENQVRVWAEKQNLKSEDGSGISQDKDTNHSPENWPRIALGQNENEKIFAPQDKLIFHPAITSAFPISQVDIFMDETFIRSTHGLLTEISIDRQTASVLPGQHFLKIIVYDNIGNRSEGQFSFTLSEL